MQTAKIAANCIRSLLLQSSASAADETIARYLLPRLLSFVNNTEPEDPERARSLIALTLSQYVATVSKDHVAIAMALIVPTLLSRAASEGAEGNVYRETSARLLEMASVDQASFRGIVAGMSEGQKAFVEEVIKSGRQTGATETDSGSSGGQPTIALKMDFGS